MLDDQSYRAARIQTAAMLALSRIGHLTAPAMQRLIELLDNDRDAALVRTILERLELVSQWRAELDEMRGRIMSIYATSFLGLPPLGALLAAEVARAACREPGMRL